MTSFYLNQFSLDQDQGDHDRLTHLHPFTLTTHDHLSPLSSYPILFNPPQPHGPSTSNHQVEFIDQLLIQGTSNFPTSFPNCTGSTFNGSKQSASSSCDQYTNGEDDGQHKCTGKWMSSKMRIMRKMMSSDGTVNQKPRRSKLVQDQEQQRSNTKPSSSRNSNNNNSSSNGIIRVCSDCYTTKTPLWRSGPSGPKSLCNACGIRQRKARRALAAAAAVSSGLIPSASAASLNPTPKVDKDSDCMDRTIPFKKRCRFQYSTGSSTSTAQNKKANKKIKKNKQQLGFDDIVIRLSKSSAFHQVFPQDEKDAAILLMALSCGLMCS